MITRRRTYGRNVDRYGYFMRNVTFLMGTLPNSNDLILNIFTKCNLVEVPVGIFNSSYRTASKKTYNQDSNGNALLTQAAVGWTVNSSTIVVVTAGQIYKSTNAGASFSKIADVTFKYSYIDPYFGPIIYSDGTKIWTAHISKLVISANQVCNRTLSIFKCNMDGSSPLRTDIFNMNRADLDLTAGAFFSTNISPLGLILLKLSGSTSLSDYYILDLKREVLSGIIRLTSPYNTGRYDGAGLWLYDGTSYGKFYIEQFSSDSGNNWTKNRYTIASSAFFSELGISANASVKAAIEQNILALVYREQGSSHYINAETLLIASSRKAGNKYFIITCDMDGENYSYIVCDKNFANASLLCHYKDLSIDLGYSLSWWPSGIYVTSDEKWGVSISNYANIVFDLVEKRFYSTALFTLFNSGATSYYQDNYLSFMVPNENVNL